MNFKTASCRYYTFKKCFNDKSTWEATVDPLDFALKKCDATDAKASNEFFAASDPKLMQIKEDTDNDIIATSKAANKLAGCMPDLGKAYTIFPLIPESSLYFEDS